ncbi:hypothetical protein Pcinc_005278 [Petrolisthes cinctipes]|uniref:Proliferation-associated SNF2-like protein n=1 Tax=Petrolisthes cinctipes TaxID=88211 RepID=A0AAE1GF74_PETCI|nr:hypothetical protein Pcinc_005278 [Petrolisthes cinctipes]
MASVLGVTEDSSSSLPECQLKFNDVSGQYDEKSLSPARPGVSPALPEENGSVVMFTEEAVHTTEDEGSVCNGLEGTLLTAEMKKEEEVLEKVNEKEEEKLRKQIEEKYQSEKELQEQRHKRLMHLLTKSEFYSQFLLKQIETQKAVTKVQRKKRSGKSDSSQGSNTTSSDCSSQESTGNKRKRQGRNTGESSASKRARHQSYKVADVIDSDVVRAKAEEKRPDNMGEEVNIEREQQPRLFQNGTMRPYQLDGFSWLQALFENGINGILGDEMGLGKTIQTIALLCHLIDQGVPGPFLVVGPLSTLCNWMSEFERFAPQIPTMLYHGPENERTEKRRKIHRQGTVSGVSNPIFPVVVTSYEVAIKDTKLLNRFEWRYICVDEAHRLKNYKCRLTKSLNTYPSTNRLLLTGTPLQNNLSELWALLNFLMPDIFDSLDVFESWFDISEMEEDGSNQKIIQQEREKQVISTMMKILSPFFLRRMKKDVDLDIPPKKEVLVYTPMTPLQAELYEATLTMNLEHFAALKYGKVKESEETEYDERGRPKRRSKQEFDYSIFMDDRNIECSPKTLEKFLNTIQKRQEKPTVEKVLKTSVLKVHLQNRMMQCRRIVNHPYLVNYPLNEDGSYKMDDGLLHVCGKLQVLDQLLTELHRRNHRVLLFSQMTKLLDILEDYLSLRPQFRYKRLDGSCSLGERQEDIHEFNKDTSEYFLFLLSTRAGGLGINLATADTVIIYDSDWNPQCDLQAQDRCHRIGQTSPVLVLRLITSATIDEKVVERAAAKRKLEKLIIQSGKFKEARQSDRSFDKTLNEEELVALLKEQDHDRIHRTATGNVFTQEEMDSLLDRSDMYRSSSGRKALHGVFKVVTEEDVSSLVLYVQY